jgi:hypothetical protein
MMKPPRHADYDRYLCSLFLQKKARLAIWGAIEYGYEIMRIPAFASEEMIGLVRVKWWQEEIQKVSKGTTPTTPLLNELSLVWQDTPHAFDYADKLCSAVAEHGFEQPPLQEHLIHIMQAYFALLCVVAQEQEAFTEYQWLAELVAKIAWYKTHSTNTLIDTATSYKEINSLWEKHTIKSTHPLYIRHLWLFIRAHVRLLNNNTVSQPSVKPWRLWWDSFTFSLPRIVTTKQ